MRRDPRAVLGLPENASLGEVRRAFRRLVLQLHPDLHAGDPRKAARLRAVVAAYEQITGRAPEPRPRRRPARPAYASRPRHSYSRPYAAPEPQPAPAARDRFGCPRCCESWSFEGTCPRCDVPLVDELRAGRVTPAADPRVDAMEHALERAAASGAWARTVGARAPVTTIASLLAGGAMALPIHVPVASMLLGYGLLLLALEATNGRALTTGA